MDLDLQDKHVLVTGASKGIGLAIARSFAQEGARITLVSRREEALRSTAEELREHSGGIIGHITADLSKEEARAALFDQAPDIDILVNNAGATWGAPAEDYPPEGWMKVMNLNVHASFFLTQTVGKRCMIPRKTGKVINIASIAGLSGNPEGMQTIAYNTSKGAMVNFTRALASEWGHYNINVNALCPGFFPSKMSQGLLDAQGDKMLERIPLKRFGGEEDLKGAAVLLASEAGRHITGQCLAVDGGTLVS